MIDRTFDSRQCERVRRNLDAYLSNELSVETAAEVHRHLETCEACARELEAKTRMRDALRKAVTTTEPPPELRQSIERRLRRQQSRFWAGSPSLRWGVAVAAVIIVVLAGFASVRWTEVQRGRRMVAGVLQLGVSDHVLCAVKGHNYPEIANPPAKLREKLGPEYAGLLAVVQQKLPGFEILEAHICSIPGSPRKYVHFITRGRGTILSVILTRRDGERLPRGSAFQTVAATNVDLYEAHLEGMNAAGFETNDYWGFVVSDLDSSAIAQIAAELAPPLKDALDARVRPRQG